MNLNLLKGIVIGIFSPIIAFIFYVSFIIETTVSSIINNPSFNINLPAIISLSLLINLVLFFLKLKFNQDEQSRGILLSTFLYGIAIVLLYFNII